MKGGFVILEEKNFSRLRELVKKHEKEGKKVFFKSGDDSLNRKVVEKLGIFGLIVPLSGRRDYMKQRDSGFNQVMAREMKKKGFALVFEVDELFGGEVIEVLSRLRQNIFLCKKSRVSLKFLIGEVKKDEKDLRALGLVLGMPTWMIKDLVVF